MVNLTNSTGSVTNSYSYSAFGSIVSQTGTVPNPYQFSTKHHNPTTGLTHFGFRYYDPTIGRFTTPDPLGLIDGPNVYAYVGNNPVNLSDPLGLCATAGSLTGTEVWDVIKRNFKYTAKNIPRIVWNEMQEAFYWPEGHPVETVFIILVGQAQFSTKPVIGKMTDLNRSGTLRPSEYRLQWQNQGTPRASWKANSSLLRKTMQKRMPIRDVSTRADTGALRSDTGFLRAERNLLRTHGWRYNPKTQHWNPPVD